mgnify:CR=1 FL=1
MHEVVAALTEQQDELTALLADLDAEGWARPSACEGWSVSDVVLHLAQTNEMATGSASGDFAGTLERLTKGVTGEQSDIDGGADALVAHERGASPAEVLARWNESCRALRAALLEHDPADRVTWVVGTMAARTLATTRLAETWIHTGDVAVGLGASLTPGDRLWHVARLAWRTLPYAFARDGLAPPGPVAFELTAPSGAPWSFQPGEPAATVIAGPGLDLCRIASRRVDPVDTALRGTGPDAEAVLAVVRTWA